MRHPEAEAAGVTESKGELEPDSEFEPAPGTTDGGSPSSRRRLNPEDEGADVSADASVPVPAPAPAPAPTPTHPCVDLANQLLKALEEHPNMAYLALGLPRKLKMFVDAFVANPVPEAVPEGAFDLSDFTIEDRVVLLKRLCARQYTSPTGASIPTGTSPAALRAALGPVPTSREERRAVKRYVDYFGGVCVKTDLGAQYCFSRLFDRDSFLGCFAKVYAGMPVVMARPSKAT